MDDTQRKRIQVFLCQKEKVGELSAGDLEKLGKILDPLIFNFSCFGI